LSDASGSRKVAFGLISAVFGVVIALAVVEFGLGVLKPSINPSGQMDEGFILYDARLGWKLAPGWQGGHSHHDFEVNYRVNPLGFRGDELDFVRPGSVMFLGDSFTFGLGVNDDEIFTELLSQSTDRNVLNVGVPGYSNDQQLLMLDKLVEYRPDVVVWVVYLGNDLLDNGEPFPLQAAHGKPYFQLVPGSELVLKNVPVPLQPKPPQYLSRSVQSEILGDYQPYMFWQRWIAGFETGHLINQWVGIDAQGLEQHLHNQPGDKVELFTAIVQQGRSDLARASVRLQVVLLPGRGLTQEGSIPAVYQETMASLLENRLKRLEIPVINMVNELKALDTPEALFHPNEGHFNRAGHEWLAEVLKGVSIL
jgi:lysophospholipase L1-like esterase